MMKKYFRFFDLTEDDKEMILSTFYSSVTFLAAFAVGLVICAVISMFCGCSRVTSDNVEEHKVEQTECEQTTVHTIDKKDVGTQESKSGSVIDNLFAKITDDSMDVSLKVTEYGDDGQPKKVTEAAIHHGKRETTSNNTHLENSRCDNAVNTSVVHDADSMNASEQRAERDDVKRVVKKSGWWHTNWRWVISCIASVLAVALLVWKRRRWVSVTVTWIRRFF